jgi:hypothetical protein
MGSCGCFYRCFCYILVELLCATTADDGCEDCDNDCDDDETDYCEYASHFAFI